jgi:hypothetical protein
MEPSAWSGDTVRIRAMASSSTERGCGKGRHRFRMPGGAAGWEGSGERRRFSPYQTKTALQGGVGGAGEPEPARARSPDGDGKGRHPAAGRLRSIAASFLRFAAFRWADTVIRRGDGSPRTPSAAVNHVLHSRENLDRSFIRAASGGHGSGHSSGQSGSTPRSSGTSWPRRAARRKTGCGRADRCGQQLGVRGFGVRRRDGTRHRTLRDHSDGRRAVPIDPLLLGVRLPAMGSRAGRSSLPRAGGVRRCHGGGGRNRASPTFGGGMPT